jgi:D-ribulokinase
MTTTREPVFVPGVWGPYHSAMVPGTWLNEGGQSVAGAAIDRLLGLHPAAPAARQAAEQQGQALAEWLAHQLAQRHPCASDSVHLAAGLHVVPEFLGNRAPHADPHARGAIVGLGMDTDLNSLLALYVAGLLGIGYGLRQIIDAQAAAGAPIDQIVLSGGAGRLDLVRQLLADATGRPVMSTLADEPVLLGGAMLGAVAGGCFGAVPGAMAAMSQLGRSYPPADGAVAVLHERRYRSFEHLQAAMREVRRAAPA